MKQILLAAAAAMMLIHPASAQRANYEALVASHAAANGVPAELVHRVIVRESRYNPRAVSKGNYGMMQIKLATARGVGYTGTAQGLLDPDTNLTYAVNISQALIAPRAATRTAQSPIMPVAITTRPSVRDCCRGSRFRRRLNRRSCCSMRMRRKFRAGIGATVTNEHH